LKVAGQECRAKLLADRMTVLERALKRLSRHERTRLAILLEKLLVGIKRDEEHAY
jgi:hypothetical protein